MKVAIGSKLRQCPGVTTVGLRLNWDDYSREEKRMIREAERIYFPTLFYAGSLHAAGKPIFPSASSYHHLGDKIRQLSLFRFLNIPMPRTMLFAGSLQKREAEILANFDFPFIAKKATGSGQGRGVFLITNREKLKTYLQTCPGVSYIQEYLDFKRDLRVVIIGNRVVHSYWKESASEDFRTNIAQGGQISFENIPQEALNLALKAARVSGIDYAGFDLCESEQGWMVIEANINFGIEGFQAAGLSLKRMLCDMVMAGEI